VFIDRDPTGIDADLVLTNDRSASQQACAHLIAHGHRTLAFLGSRSNLWSTEERRRGFADALQEAGIPFESAEVIQDLHDEDAARAATVMLLNRPDRPTALFSSQNDITVGALHALHELGLEQTVAIVGFNDLPLADLIEPGLTAMVQNPYQMGRIAASRALARIDGDEIAQRIVLKSALVVRGSGEIAPTK
jgi:LacI family transcriptional regulator